MIMPKTKRVLFFTQAGVGGAERITVLIAKMLDMSKFDVEFVVIPKGNVSNCIVNFIPKGYKITLLKEDSPLGIIRQLHKCVMQRKPDIVFSSVFYINNKLLLLRGLFPKTKFIIRCENYFYTFNKKQQYMLRFIYRMADKIIGQTKEMSQELLDIGINPAKVVTLENPIDEPSIKNKLQNDKKNPFPQNGRKHFLASGRFAYQKGFDLLVEAFADLCRTNRDADLYIIGNITGGNEPEYKRVMQIAQERNITDRVFCVGFQNNPYNWMLHADCFVLSSRWEGLPNVLVEALYLGTPVAAFKCIPIIERIVDEQHTGYLAEKEDIHSLALAMNQAIQLGRVVSTYQGAQPEDFIKLFEEP